MNGILLRLVLFAIACAVSVGIVLLFSVHGPLNVLLGFVLGSVSQIIANAILGRSHQQEE